MHSLKLFCGGSDLYWKANLCPSGLLQPLTCFPPFCHDHPSSQQLWPLFPSPLNKIVSFTLMLPSPHFTSVVMCSLRFPLHIALYTKKLHFDLIWSGHIHLHVRCVPCMACPQIKCFFCFCFLSKSLSSFFHKVMY